MGHKFKGVKPRKSSNDRCNLCWQKLSEERETKWFQGKPYHKDCFDKEMEKPLHKRFKKR